MIQGLPYEGLIRSFKDRASRDFWETGRSREFPAHIGKACQRKLAMLDAAARLEDLRIPPGNRLHALSGDRKGQHSISINDQFRICFIWKNGDAFDVEITDYH